MLQELAGAQIRRQEDLQLQALPRVALLSTPASCPRHGRGIGPQPYVFLSGGQW